MFPFVNSPQFSGFTFETLKIRIRVVPVTLWIYLSGRGREAVYMIHVCLETALVQHRTSDRRYCIIVQYTRTSVEIASEKGGEIVTVKDYKPDLLRCPIMMLL